MQLVLRRYCPFVRRNAFIRSIMLYSAIFLRLLKNCKPALDVWQEAWIFQLSLCFFFFCVCVFPGCKLLRLSYLNTTCAVYFSLHLEHNVLWYFSFFFFFEGLLLYNLVIVSELILLYIKFSHRKCYFMLIRCHKIKWKCRIYFYSSY